MTNAYEARRRARVERLRERAESARQQGKAQLERADGLRNFIPLGQPILVGHHSEGKHRRDLARINSWTRKGMRELAHARELDRRARAAEASTAVSSDDPDAIAKLREKLARKESSMAAMKLANRLIRSPKRTNDSHEAIAEQVKAAGYHMTAFSIASARRNPFGRPGFSTTNTAAEIRRLKARIAELQSAATRTPMSRQTLTVGNDSIDVYEADNRVRVAFSRKPTKNTCAFLRSKGFVYSHTVGAWQRMAKPGIGQYAYELVARKLAERAERGTPW